MTGMPDISPTPPNDGGPAFPGFWLEGSAGGGWTWKSVHEGMSLRDYFAGQLLCSVGYANISGQPIYRESAANVCYEMADAMLKAREKKP